MGYSKDILSWGFILAIIDCLIVVLNCVLFYKIIFSGEAINTQYLLAIIIMVMMFLITAYFTGVYRSWMITEFTIELKAITITWVVIIAAMSTLAFIAKSGATFSRVWFITTSIGSCGLMFMVRGIFRYVLTMRKGRMWNCKNIVIIGTSEHGFNIANQIQEKYWSGFNIIGFFDDLDESSYNSSYKYKILGDIDDVDGFLAQQNTGSNDPSTIIHQVWVATPNLDRERKQQFLNALKLYSLDIIFVPNLQLSANDNQELTRVAGLPVLVLKTSSLSANQQFLKYIEDYLFSALILIAISPIMLFIAIGVKLSSPGPVFYIQERVTLFGKHFKMLKFRTMPVDTEASTGPVWAKPGENRATAFGAFLRSTSLDELPQFFNVLRGEMSIVGPRPERPAFVEEFKNEIPHYMKKHLMKAGITGWAQINGFRGNTSLNKRIEHDIYYIDNWNFSLDLKIIVKTLSKGFISNSAY